MHKQVKQFMASLQSTMPHYFVNQSVIEIGSRNINGSARQFFSNCEYAGFDLTPGDGVDVVCHFSDYTWTKKPNVIVSTEALEHDNRWADTLRSIQATIKQGGLCIVTCATYGRPEHGTERNGPQDSPATLGYYRNLGIAEFVEARFLNGWSEFHISVNNICHDMYFWGIRE